jgi:hypothetical protein
MVAFGRNMGGAAGRIIRTRSVSVDMFFDRQKLIGQMSKAQRRALNRAGATIRTIAKRSMRPRKLGIASAPGQPPHRHRNKGGKGVSEGLYKSILYGYDSATESVVIGPSSTWGPGVHRLMETHEFGGSERKKNARRRIRKVGGPGELRYGKSASRVSNKLRASTRRAKDTLRGTVEVTYGKLFTAEQARRANRINLELYGPTILHSVYPPRPTMGPALAQVAPRLPAMIRDEWAK